jgi:hypothetical protein
MTTDRILLHDRSIPVVFTRGKLKGSTGTVVDVRHEGHHVRVALDGGRVVSTRPGSIAAAADHPHEWGRLLSDPGVPACVVCRAPFDNGGWEGADDDDPRYLTDPDF